MNTPCPTDWAIPLLREISSLRERIGRTADRILLRWDGVLGESSGYRASAANLASYLALRGEELRGLQDRLGAAGLSSLGRGESRVEATLGAVAATLSRLAAEDGETGWPAPESFRAGLDALRGRADEILGRSPSSRVRIMVTLPTEAATDRAWARGLVEAGASCVRINCSHDGPEVWKAMIRNVRAAAKSLGREVRVQMDLTGPRARTLATLHLGDGDRARVGDTLLLAKTGPSARLSADHAAACSIPEIVEALRPGAVVFFNEGRLGAKVVRRVRDGVRLEVFRAKEKGEHFRDEMAINVPGTDLDLDPLTAQDRAHLDFVVAHADVVGYSFVQRAGDMDALHAEIAARASIRKVRRPLGIVAKIETAQAVRNLPDLIVHGAARAPFAVMIARGDLAVELGPVRLAEIQEELLWLCEAAHVPVIWATQMLETLAKKGLPTRAELTDAAMSERAECVMLNKGPCIFEAVRLLDEVLGRMADHQVKKMATFRPLRSWEHVLASPVPALSSP